MVNRQVKKKITLPVLLYLSFFPETLISVILLAMVFSLSDFGTQNGLLHILTQNILYHNK